MLITRLRLLGFKSFVEPTELVIERGLTGVVGPNGCGKSNLLEALRWVMGETSHKSMRAAAMDDVIFSGTSGRPARNWAEVTIAIDNSKRTAPAGFNDSDTIEITRRIEREMGSAYRINAQEARARDVKILFEDAATGARSPALVRQGQISEIVNAKPEQRRRILEDAAGVAGLHTRRHEAELRLRAAEANLARIGDVLGQLNSQIESLKRQARQARRYKELSGEIRRCEALFAHLAWSAAQDEVVDRERALEAALSTLGLAVEAEAKAVKAEHAAAEVIPSLREAEMTRAAILSRLKIEQDTFEREARRTVEREGELKARIAQLSADLEREEAIVGEAAEILERLEAERSELAVAEETAEEAAADARHRAQEAEGRLAIAQDRLDELNREAFEKRARAQSVAASLAERTSAAERLSRQRVAIEGQIREVQLKAPDAIRLVKTQGEGRRLAEDVTDIEARTLEAEALLAEATAAAQAARADAEAARIELSMLKTERDTLARLVLPAGEGGHRPAVDAISVEAGYEAALGAALGDDLEAALEADAPAYWRVISTDKGDPALPKGVEAIAAKVDAPPELQRRLAQIGVVTRGEGELLQPRLKPGQRLVSVEGDLWRWDGFVARAEAPTAAAQRLAQRNRLTEIDRKWSRAEKRAAEIAERDRVAAARASELEAHVRSLRQSWRETQAELTRTREALGIIEQAARETEAKLAHLADTRAEAETLHAEALERVAEMEMAAQTLAEDDGTEALIAGQQRAVVEARASASDARQKVARLDTENDVRRRRIETLVAELARWVNRTEGARQQQRTLGSRIEDAKAELERHSVDPDAIAKRRSDLIDAIALAEHERQAAADALAEGETALREASQALRAAQAAVSTEREGRARLEARLEAARARRTEEARKIRESLDVDPGECLALAGVAGGEALPPLADTERQLARLKADRERLGGVNLQADEELSTLSTQFEGLDKERADVEEAIAKLRAGIGQLNREGKRRLMDAFQSVDQHFRQLFTTLFGGGEARLEMIESEDPLEGGLEIIAKPPGKKPATLSLLSGGEQTLTALSLIFAVFLTNPSPICVLDEVDAPLDDANVDRFCTLMEHMAADTETRFLVITHHPMTMARMNRLFGVTMAEKGVSQLVSVDLATAEKFLEAV